MNRPGTIFFIAALAAALFLLLGGWLFVLSGQWRLLAAAIASVLFCAPALWQHRRHNSAAQPEAPERRDGYAGLKIDLGARPASPDQEDD